MKIKTLSTHLLLLALLAGCSKSTPPAISIQDATRTGNLEAIQQHIKAASNLNEKAPDSGGSPLNTAAAFGQIAAARALIQAGADLNSRAKDGGTPLMTAAVPLPRRNRPGTLGPYGADKNAKNYAGATALDSVAGSFDEVKGIYDLLQAALGPVGLKLDYEQIKVTRPEIAKLLR